MVGRRVGLGPEMGCRPADLPLSRWCRWPTRRLDGPRSTWGLLVTPRAPAATSSPRSATSQERALAPHPLKRSSPPASSSGCPTGTPPLRAHAPRPSQAPPGSNVNPEGSPLPSIAPDCVRTQSGGVRRDARRDARRRQAGEQKRAGFRGPEPRSLGWNSRRQVEQVMRSPWLGRSGRSAEGHRQPAAPEGAGDGPDLGRRVRFPSRAAISAP